MGGRRVPRCAPQAGRGGAKTIVAERIRAVSRLRDHGDTGSTVAVSVTIGGAVWAADDSVDQIIHRADAALYRGKSDGRDTVRIATPGSLPSRSAVRS